MTVNSLSISSFWNKYDTIILAAILAALSSVTGYGGKMLITHEKKIAVVETKIDDVRDNVKFIRDNMITRGNRK